MTRRRNIDGAPRPAGPGDASATVVPYDSVAGAALVELRDEQYLSAAVEAERANEAKAAAEGRRNDAAKDRAAAKRLEDEAAQRIAELNADIGRLSNELKQCEDTARARINDLLNKVTVAQGQAGEHEAAARQHTAAAQAAKATADVFDGLLRMMPPPPDGVAPGRSEKCPYCDHTYAGQPTSEQVAAHLQICPGPQSDGLAKDPASFDNFIAVHVAEGTPMDHIPDGAS